MSLDATREVWFVTRPQRDPRFHKDALEALAEATSNFTEVWDGNRDVQKKYEEVLISRNLKKDKVSESGSGGRTWAAMLKTFAYVFVDSTGIIKPTRVGEQIIKGIEVKKNVTKQILTLQIPNAYSLSTGFRPKYDVRFSIRPARFIIKLANEPKLDNYITKDEITFFAMTAKKDSELTSIIEEILSFRHSLPADQDIIKKTRATTYDHRARLDSVARDYEEAHGDVSHTFMLICDYTELCVYKRGEATLHGIDSIFVRKIINHYDERYPFNQRYRISLQRMAENNGLDIDSYKSSRYHNIVPASNREKYAHKIQNTISKFPLIGNLPKDKIISLFENEFSIIDSARIAENIKKNPISIIDDSFVDSYLNQPNNRLFEDQTMQLLKLVGFEVVERPKAKNGASTEIEILVKYGTNECGILDAKNYSQKFSLTSHAASLMATDYIPNYDKYDDHELKFFGYVTAGKFLGLKNLSKITTMANAFIYREIKGFMISASFLVEFIDYCLEKEIKEEKRIEMFLKLAQNGGFSSLGDIMPIVA